MDVRRIEVEGDVVRARVADAAGERDVELRGEAAARIRAAAPGLGGSVVLADGVLLVDGHPGDARRGQPLAHAVIAELRPRERPVVPRSLDADFWSGVYRNGQDGWELARATPPLVSWVAGQDLRALPALVLGAGRGHEARLLAEAGARVTAVDYAPEAIAEARRLHGDLGIDFRQADLFGLPAVGERWPLVVEHCCFCAIDPARRDEYVDVVAEVLAPGGRLVGLYWAHGRAGGPPFTVTREELLARLGRRLNVESVEVPADSVAGRLGQELLVVARSGAA